MMDNIENAPKNKPILIHLSNGTTQMVSYRKIPVYELDEENGQPIESDSGDEFWEFWINTDENGDYPEDFMPDCFPLIDGVLGWSEIGKK